MINILVFGRRMLARSRCRRIQKPLALRLALLALGLLAVVFSTLVTA